MDIDPESVDALLNKRMRNLTTDDDDAVYGAETESEDEDEEIMDHYHRTMSAFLNLGQEDLYPALYVRPDLLQRRASLLALYNAVPECFYNKDAIERVCKFLDDVYVNELQNVRTLQRSAQNLLLVYEGGLRPSYTHIQELLRRQLSELSYESVCSMLNEPTERLRHLQAPVCEPSFIDLDKDFFT